MKTKIITKGKYKLIFTYWPNDNSMNYDYVCMFRGVHIAAHGSGSSGLGCEPSKKDMEKDLQGCIKGFESRCQIFGIEI